MRSILALVVLPLAAALSESRSVQSGVYTVEQAERGGKKFEERCTACHEPAEFGEGGYMEGWEGQKMADLVDLIRSTMPEDSPGSLQRQDYLDVGAFLLSINGVPPGEAELDSNSVKDVVIEGPFKAAGEGH